VRTEDGDLIRACLKGDETAFGFLVDKYKSCVYAKAYASLRNFQDAEDMTQEVFLKAYQKLRSLKQYDRFLAWLYAITANLCKNFLRSKEARPDGTYLEDIEQPLLDAPSVDAYEEKGRYESLYEALERLPQMYRDVLTLHYLGGMKGREIAAFLGTSADTINMRLSRARSLLKEEMLAMMSATFEGHRLQPSFTFRIVEIIKGTKIQSASTTKWIPFGVSGAMGLIALLLSWSVPYNPLYPIGELIGSALPSRTQVAETGVIPVDATVVTQITILSSESGKKDFGQKPKLEQEKTFGSGKWERKADMPTARATSGSAVIDGKIYIIGGFAAGNALSTVEMYDPETDTWRKGADMPTARGYFATASVNGKIYIFGGRTFVDPPQTFATVEAYETITDKWTKKADMPMAKRWAAAIAVNGKIYVIGGGIGVALSAVDMYDPLTDTWTKKADMPTARQGLSLALVDGKIYAIGGVNSAGTNLSTVEVYDPETDKWSKKADMPTARSHLAASVVNKKIYTFGGGWDRAWSNVEVYDPATDTWEKKADMPMAKGWLSANEVNGKVYIMGGGDSRVDEYDPGVEKPQSVTPTGKFPTQWGEVKVNQ